MARKPSPIRPHRATLCDGVIYEVGDVLCIYCRKFVPSSRIEDFKLAWIVCVPVISNVVGRHRSLPPMSILSSSFSFNG